MSAPTVISTTPYSSNTVPVTGFTITKPATDVGDLLLIIICKRNSAAVTPDQAGWQPVAFATQSTTLGCTVYSKITTADEPEQYSFSSAGNSKTAATLIRLKGTDQANPVLAVQTDSKSSGSHHTTPPVSTGRDATLLLSIWAAQSGGGREWLDIDRATTEVTQVSSIGASSVYALVGQSKVGSARVAGNKTSTFSSSAAHATISLAIQRPAFAANTTRVSGQGGILIEPERTYEGNTYVTTYDNFNFEFTSGHTGAVHVVSLGGQAGDIHAEGQVGTVNSSPQPGRLIGDLNQSGAVDAFDLSLLLAVFGQEDATADLNQSGTVDAFDLSILLSKWQNSTADLPPVPGNLQASMDGHHVMLSWDGVAEATHYQIKRSTSSESGYITLQTEHQDTSFHDHTVMHGLTYYYVVSAVNEAGNSGDSSPASAATIF